MNQSMHNMYKTSNSRKNSEDEAPIQADVNSPQIQTDVITKSQESVIKTSLPNNPSIVKEIENTDSSKVVVEGQTPKTKSERPDNDIVRANGKQNQKSTKKGKGSSRSKDTQKKTGAKNNLIDDSGIPLLSAQRTPMTWTLYSVFLIS